MTYIKNQYNQAPFSGNKLADPNVDTVKYFNQMKLITEAVRKSGLGFIRVFSEPRKTTGYRTKFWGMSNYVAEVQGIVDRLYPGEYNVTYKSTTSKTFHYMLSSINIAPKDKSNFMNN